MSFHQVIKNVHGKAAVFFQLILQRFPDLFYKSENRVQALEKFHLNNFELRRWFFYLA